MPSGRNRYPDSPVFYRHLQRDFPRITRGQGCWLEDDQGRRYLDASGGAFVTNLGHGDAGMATALAEQAKAVAYVNGTAFTNEPAEALAAELASLAPKGLDKSYFLCSGSEAVEAALKLARQYWVETGKPGKHKILTQTPGYHGNTLLALSASAREHYRRLYQPWLLPVPMVAAPYPYRCPCRGAKDCPTCSGEILEEAILKEGPDTVAAFIAEPVGGSSTGASVPRRDYWKRAADICRRHQVLFIADEVLTGCGRTGRWLAMEHYAATPDILVLGKGLSGGYAPLSAVMTSRTILDPIARGPGYFSHAQTFSHTPLICAAGLAAVRRIKKDGLVERCRRQGEVLQAKLAALKDLPGVGDVRGIGLLAGVEFVEDKASRKPFARGRKIAEAFTEKALEAGLVIWPNTGQADGINGDIAMIAPPFVIDDSEIDEISARFKTAWTKTLKEIRT